MSRRTLAVAITGGIASGKSEMASLFGEMGALILSADLEAREVLLSDGSVQRKIIKLLGEKAYTAGGRVNRAFIAEQIFTRPTLRRGVNAIVHPAVIKRIARKISLEKKKKKRDLVVVEAALIYEAGMDKMFDAIIVVESPSEVRIGRMRRRDGITRREALSRIRAQGSSRKKAEIADFVVSNRGDRRTLRQAARFLYRLLSGIAGIGSTK